MTTLLFDLDGTLVDSRAVVERQWRVLCDRLGLDFPSVLAILHGVRSVDVIRAVAPGVDAEAEAALLDAAEQDDTEGLVLVQGARELLSRLPDGGWGIVTSGHRTLAEGRLRAVGLPVPPVMVCGDEVAAGKPDPEGYLAGARLLGTDPGDCVVCEDAPAGIQAARAAGMAVIGITTTHTASALTGADAVIADLTGLEDALAAIGRVAPGEPGAPRR
ncbi:MAG TPA: HAD-IA family hydrolase [Gaiellales bacterium]|jgi:sugar-phosphatase|nr:HAD-IA family hydrolase [Gaiellales bacterium]